VKDQAIRVFDGNPSFELGRPRIDSCLAGRHCHSIPLFSEPERTGEVDLIPADRRLERAELVA
jgi:hypothetical protein